VVFDPLATEAELQLQVHFMQISVVRLLCWN